jgi:aminoglycoside phosphotransferase (APT) family kinase protein
VTLLADMLPKVNAYLRRADLSPIPGLDSRNASVRPLAQGEYNLNYRLEGGRQPLVLRVNFGTQIGREDQIRYEYRTLELLADSGVTPRPFFVDDSRRWIDHGILIMAYLPGGPLDYTRDLDAAARVLAAVHQVAVAEERNHLIREQAPLSLIFDECDQLLTRYFESPLAQAPIRDYLMDLREWMRAARVRERYYQQDPWPCIVNTEVNSGNFIVDRRQSRAYLVDWEMPRWGDPSQDLSHFCSPLTTLWKTDYRMTDRHREAFLASYRRQMADRHLAGTLDERLRLRDPFVLLRGISWSAMGWVAYQTEFAGARNADTWRTLQQYLQLPFIRAIFDPILRTDPTAG